MSAWSCAGRRLGKQGTIIPAGNRAWIHHETSGLQQDRWYSLVSFVEVRFPKGLSDEGMLLLAHELRQRVGQRAPVTVLTQGVQQDPCQVLGGHLAERERCRLRLL